MNEYTKTANAHITDARICLDASRKLELDRRALLIAEAQAEATIALANATLAVATATERLADEAARSAAASAAIEREMPRIRGALGMGR